MLRWTASSALLAAVVGCSDPTAPSLPPLGDFLPNTAANLAGTWDEVARIYWVSSPARLPPDTDFVSLRTARVMRFAPAGDSVRFELLRPVPAVFMGSLDPFVLHWIEDGELHVAGVSITSTYLQFNEGRRYHTFPGVLEPQPANTLVILRRRIVAGTT